MEANKILLAVQIKNLDPRVKHVRATLCSVRSNGMPFYGQSPPCASWVVFEAPALLAVLVSHFRWSTAK